MDKIIKLEELAQFAAVVAAIYYIKSFFPGFGGYHFSWWAWILIFLLPDLGMVGYTVNTTAGAITYNLLHHKFTAVFLLGIGCYTALPYITLAGLVLYGHSSVDRALGYGLKYFDSFQHTHNGMIGK